MPEGMRKRETEMKQMIVTCEEFDKIDFVPTLIIGFYQSGVKASYFRHYAELKERFPDVDVIGCSTESNIYDVAPHLDVNGDHLCVYMCLGMNPSACRFEIFDLDEPAAFDAGEGKKYGTVILSSAYSPNVEAVLQTLPRQTGTTAIFGAVASSADPERSKPEIFCNGNFYDHHMLFWLIDQSCYTLDGFSLYHFRPVGFELEVTDARGSTLYMLDNRPALGVLEEMIGELLDGTIEAFNHPFFIAKRQNYDFGGSLPLCSIKCIDREKQSIELYRNVFVKDRLKVGIALSLEEQEERIRQFYEMAAPNSVAILFNCIGIKQNLGMMEHLYLIDIRRHLRMPFIGFHSFGEIGSIHRNSAPLLHNQTMSIAVISEKEGASCD